MLLFIIKIGRWILGTVTFIVSGAFYERIVNLALKNKIQLWDLHADSNCLTATTYASNYKKLRPLAKTSKVKMKIQKKNGFPFWRFRYRKRYGIVIGLILAVLFIGFLSTRVWSITVTGCTYTSPEVIKEQLRDLGLHYGVSSRSVDADYLEKSMIVKNNDIAWIAVNIVHSTADIQIHERSHAPEMQNPEDKVANIIAEMDGHIKYMEIYNGQLLVKVNEVVSKGDLIISGIMEDSYGNTRAVYAKGKVIAQVYIELYSSVPLEQTLLVPDGETYTEKHLLIGDRAFPLSLPKLSKPEFALREEYIKEISSSPKIALRLTFVTPQKEDEVTLSVLEAKELAQKDLKAQEILLEAEKIISREEQHQVRNGVYTASETLIIEKDIAKTAEILFYPRQTEDNVVK